ALGVFVGAGGLADEADLDAGLTVAEDGLRAGGGELGTARASLDFPGEDLKGMAARFESILRLRGHGCVLGCYGGGCCRCGRGKGIGSERWGGGEPVDTGEFQALEVSIELAAEVGHGSFLQDDRR